MKLAVIPPTEWAPIMIERPYNLYLPQLLMSAKYKHCVIKNEGFSILDNGVAEGYEFRARHLMSMATDAGINEIVVQDHLGKAVESVNAAHDFMKALKGRAKRFEGSFMGVIQGQTYDQLLYCAEHYLEHMVTPITTIGVPRNLIYTLGEASRLVIVQKLRERFGKDFAIHLLGTNPTYILELLDHGSAFRHFNVRGVDTSAPFVYALAGSHIADGEVFSRQRNYFQEPIPTHPEILRLIDANLKTMEGWVSGVQAQAAAG